MRKSKLKEGPIEYYHIYPKSENANNSIVVKVQGGRLESLTNHFGETIFLKTLNESCGVRLQEGKLIVNEGYNLGKISGSRVFRKYEEFKEKGSPNWLKYNSLTQYLMEATM